MRASAEQATEARPSSFFVTTWQKTYAERVACDIAPSFFREATKKLWLIISHFSWHKTRPALSLLQNLAQYGYISKNNWVIFPMRLLFILRDFQILLVSQAFFLPRRSKFKFIIFAGLFLPGGKSNTKLKIGRECWLLAQSKTCLESGHTKLNGVIRVFSKSIKSCNQGVNLWSQCWILDKFGN